MLSVDECILESEDVMVVIFVHASVELREDSQLGQITITSNILMLTKSSTETSIMLWLK